MKCTKCLLKGHRGRDCHKIPRPAPELMEEDEGAPQDAEDTVPLPTGEVGKLLGDLLSKHEETSEHVGSISALLNKCLINFEKQDKVIDCLVDQLNGTNDRLDRLAAENRALQAEVAKLRQSFSAPPAQPPPPPPPPHDTPCPTTPPPPPKRKRNPGVGATPRKPPKQPRETSPSSPTPTRVPPTKDQGRAEVTERSKGGKSKGKSGESVQVPGRGSGGRQGPTWAQVARGGGVHVTVYVVSGSPTPNKARPPKCRKGKDKERKASGSGPGKRNGKEASRV